MSKTKNIVDERKSIQTLPADLRNCENINKRLSKFIRFLVYSLNIHLRYPQSLSLHIGASQNCVLDSSM